MKKIPDQLVHNLFHQLHGTQSLSMGTQLFTSLKADLGQEILHLGGALIKYFLKRILIHKKTFEFFTLLIMGSLTEQFVQENGPLRHLGINK